MTEKGVGTFMYIHKMYVSMKVCVCVCDPDIDDFGFS